MCGRFEALSINNISKIVLEIKNNEDLMLDLGWDKQISYILPGYETSIIVLDNNEVSTKYLRWGYPSPKNFRSLIFNTRIETADTKYLWKSSYEKRRCIIVSFSFFETHLTEKGINKKGDIVKQIYRFNLKERSPMFLAGIWKDNYFSLLTHQASDRFSNIHNRLPIIIKWKYLNLWLKNGSINLFDENNLETYPIYKAQKKDSQNSLF